MTTPPLEAALARLWSRILRVNGVGRNDDFLLLGGDRLSLASIIASVNSLFRVNLKIESLPQDAMTVAGMARVIVAVRSDAAADKQNPTRPTVIPRRQEGEAAHLSAAQRRMWFLARLDPDDPTYNQSRAYRLVGEVDVDTLERSVHYIARRHEILRTSYSLVDDEPVLIVHEDFAVEMKRADFSEVPSSQQNRALQALLLSEMKKPFDLESRPPWRMLLVHLSRREHVLLRVSHHIVHDGWTSGVFERELSTVYSSFVQGLESHLPALPVQYADYAAWQRELLQGNMFEGQLSYWKIQLAGLSKLDLPTDRPRPPIASHRGASLTVDLPGPLVAALKGIGQQDGTTLFMKLVAIFQVLLYRYSGQEDIAVGVPIAGRKRTELEGLLGFFANTLVLRTDLSGNPGFRELLARMRKTALDAYTHQDVPFEKLVVELAPERDMSRNPLFQVMFVLQNVPDAALQMEGLKVSSLPIESHSAKFDLTLFVRESPQGFQTDWEYASDLFDAVTVKRMARHFARLLEAVVADPDQPIGELPMLTESERNQLLVEWNETRKDSLQNYCVHELFEQQVERTPESIAVVFEDQQLTYKELNDRANQLAHYLQMLGVGKDVPVGLCVERSADMIVALLGILKAGGAYVPIDPELPGERIRFMLHDSQASFLLTQARLDELIPSLGSKRIIIERDWAAIAREKTTNLDQRPNSDSLAYVIYTSGSTGRPKGVMISHRGLTNYLCWAIEAYEVAQGQGAPVHSSISFDLTVTSLFAPLLVGRKVVILAENRGVQALADLLRLEPRFSFVKLTPAHLSVLARELLPDKLAESGRTFILGGEALTYELLKPWAERTRTPRVINEYGPTETVVGCCAYEADLSGSSSGPVPIGRPIANTQVYILDPLLQLVPIGVAGEIYIGGDGVARGYLNQPELTAVKFIKNPFSDDPRSRLYKTGDLARYLRDGNIEFLGRKDDQVKIRGFRIELGEIEAMLTEHPSVRGTVVLAREDSPGDKRLVAYVVTNSGPTEGNELRGFLQQKLPAYMVPSAFVFLDALPLTPNGKVDRRALPTPQYDHEKASNKFVAPRDTLEESIAKVWCEVLQLERIGVHDNFFELGGHSLTAMQVVARLRRTFRSEIAPRDIFNFPTIAKLADIGRTLEPLTVEDIIPISWKSHEI